MVKKLKVWGGSWNGRGRAIVAAPTKKRAVELLKGVTGNFSRHYFDGYWCETGNAMELAMATKEGVWISKDQPSAKYEPVEPRFPEGD